MNNMSTQKLLKICAGCVVVVWLFCIGIVLGTYMTRNGIMTVDTTTTVPINTETTTQIVIDIVTNQAAPTTTEKVSVDITTGDSGLTTYNNGDNQGTTSGDVDQTNSQNSVAQEPQTSVPTTKEEIVKSLVDAINNTKATKNFTAERKHNMSVVVDEITGGSVVKNIADSVIAKNSNMTDSTFTFVNGVDTAGSGETPNSLFFPDGKQAELDPSAVKTATATATDNGDGTYTVHVELNPENQTLTSPAVNHDGIYETISIESFGLPSNVNVTSMYANYNNSSIDATINAEGKLKSIKYCMPVSEGGGEGKMLGMTVSIKMHGQYDGTITCTYG